VVASQQRDDAVCFAQQVGAQDDGIVTDTWHLPSMAKARLAGRVKHSD
jgi:hypothetical protein